MISLEQHQKILQNLCSIGFIDPQMYLSLLTHMKDLTIETEEDAMNFVNMIYYYRNAIPVDLGDHQTLISTMNTTNILSEKDYEEFEKYVSKNPNLRVLKSGILPKVEVIRMRRWK